MDVSIPGPQLKQKTLQGYRFVSENDLEAPSGWHPVLSKAEWGNVLACTGPTLKSHPFLMLHPSPWQKHIKVGVCRYLGMGLPERIKQ